MPVLTETALWLEREKPVINFPHSGNEADNIKITFVHGTNRCGILRNACKLSEIKQNQWKGVIGTISA